MAAVFNFFCNFAGLVLHKTRKMSNMFFHTVSLTAAQCLCAAAGLLSLGALLGILWARRQETD